MKKTLVAIAALAATGAFAQSSVTIDGIVDAGYQSINYKGDSNTQKGIAGNGSSTSQFNFRGSEDLGGGLKAEFRVETDWNLVSNMANAGTASSVNATTTASSINSSASTFGNGELRVGLADSKLGRIDVGAVNYNTLSTYGTGQPFGTAIGSGFRNMFINDGQSTSQVRAENSLKYVSPSFSGLTVSLYKSNKQSQASNSTPASSATNGLNPQANAFSTALGAYDQIGTTEIGANYANGPLAASFSSLKQDSTGIGAASSTAAATTGANLKVNTLGANYALNSQVKLFALHQTVKNDLTGASTKVDRAATTLSATYTTGNLVLMAQTGSLKADAGTYTGNKSKLTGIGADYNLSKRTAVYFRTETFKDEARVANAAMNPQQIAGSASVAGLTDQKMVRTAIGIRHSF